MHTLLQHAAEFLCLVPLAPCIDKSRDQHDEHITELLACTNHELCVMTHLETNKLATGAPSE